MELVKDDAKQDGFGRLLTESEITREPDQDEVNPLRPQAPVPNAGESEHDYNIRLAQWRVEYLEPWRATVEFNQKVNDGNAKLRKERRKEISEHQQLEAYLIRIFSKPTMASIRAEIVADGHEVLFPMIEGKLKALYGGDIGRGQLLQWNDDLRKNVTLDKENQTGDMVITYMDKLDAHVGELERVPGGIVGATWQDGAQRADMVIAHMRDNPILLPGAENWTRELVDVNLFCNKAHWMVLSDPANPNSERYPSLPLIMQDFRNLKVSMLRIWKSLGLEMKAPVGNSTNGSNKPPFAGNVNNNNNKKALCDCPYSKTKQHLEKTCWNKHPELAPAHYQDMVRKRMEGLGMSSQSKPTLKKSGKKGKKGKGKANTAAGDTKHKEKAPDASVQMAVGTVGTSGTDGTVSLAVKDANAMEVVQRCSKEVVAELGDAIGEYVAQGAEMIAHANAVVGDGLTDMELIDYVSDDEGQVDYDTVLAEGAQGQFASGDDNVITGNDTMDTAGENANKDMRVELYFSCADANVVKVSTENVSSIYDEVKSLKMSGKIMLDSGCSQTMTPDKKLVANMTNQKGSVNLADKSSIPSIGLGTVALRAGNIESFMKNV
ncbi:hypothetical protein HDU76_009876, partial [Blyttiomyces sp. JEL0837]